MEFNEYMIKRQKGPKEFVLTVLLYVAATILALLCMIFLLRLSGIGFLLAFGCYFFAHKLSAKMSKEFEYIRTEDNVDIDVIMNTTNRKRLVSFSVKDVEVIASVTNEKYKDKLNGSFSKVIDATSGRSDANIYFVVIKDKNMLVKFEPPYSILTNLRSYAPSKVVIDE